MRLIDADIVRKKAESLSGGALWSDRSVLTLLDCAPTVEPPPNPPLTLDELREMGGEPVWIERSDGGANGWAIAGDAKSIYGFYFGTAKGGMRLPYDECGKTWLAYRRKPEEGRM